MNSAERILVAIIQQCSPNQGRESIYSYFHDPSVRCWEEEARKGCQGLACRRKTQPATASEVAQMIDLINGRYQTRHPQDQIPYLSRQIVGQLSSREWWNSPPPQLLTCSKTCSIEIADCLRKIISRIECWKEKYNPSAKRPYSLLTKYLHFTFPDTFPIYDSRAAFSMWRCQGAAADRLFDRIDLDYIESTSGSGYPSILEFYRLLWNRSRPSQHRELKRQAKDISAALGCRITPLTLMDKVFWKAGGKLGVLGLR